ncbi:MAG TPA: hypothetical protein VFJ72_13100 [Rubrobacteraceae bacterium]|nr:hypothetical protein [Rubrobacteraceae bacterium]
MTTAPRASAISGVQIGVIVLTAATALIHLYLGLQGFPIFILNGLGYLGLLGALYLPLPQLARYHNAARWALIGYAALTIFLWVLIGLRTPIGYTDKLIEVALIALLVLEGRRQR